MQANEEDTMIVDPHDLDHEFPEYREAIVKLKAADTQFAEMVADYQRVNREVQRAEENDLPISDRAFEDLKKQRLKLKDAIYGKLSGK